MSYTLEQFAADCHDALKADPGKARSAVRRWLGHLALFVTALTLLGDALYVVYSFLNGDLTLQAIARAAVTGAVAGAIFLFFRTELRGADDGK